MCEPARIFYFFGVPHSGEEEYNIRFMHTTDQMMMIIIIFILH
jgi:hypothetical protein